MFAILEPDHSIRFLISGIECEQTERSSPTLKFNRTSIRQIAFAIVIVASSEEFALFVARDKQAHPFWRDVTHPYDTHHAKSPMLELAAIVRLAIIVVQELVSKLFKIAT